MPLNASINNKKQLFTTKPRWFDISTEVNFGAAAPEPRGPFCGCFQLASPAPLSPLSHKGCFCNSSVKSHLKPNFKQIWWIFALSSALLSIQFHSKFKNLQPKKHAQLMWDCLSSHCFPSHYHYQGLEGPVFSNMLQEFIFHSLLLEGIFFFFFQNSQFQWR